MTLAGLQPLRLAEPVCHVGYYEADAESGSTLRLRCYKPARQDQPAFIRSIRMRAVSGLMIRASGSTPARSFSRSSRPLIETCL